MRISDWSSDVCSSDLQISQRQQSAVEDFRDANLQIASLVAQQISGGVRWNKPETITPTLEGVADFGGSALEIGRASCRERVCQYVYISVVAVYIKNKTQNQITDKRQLKPNTKN